jgi:hypothetical protein
VQYTIVAESGERVTVEAPSWMMAMGRAMSKLGLGADAMGRWVCTPRANGVVTVDDPVARQRWTIYQGDATAIPVPEVKPPAAKPWNPPASVPVSEPGDLAERLFDLSFDIAGASSDEAGQLALSLLNEFISCEAASVVRGSLNDVALNVIAASGPVGDQVVGMKIPFGTGIVGLCFDMGISIQVDDVSRNKHHLVQVDSSTGFETRAMLCVPIRDDMQKMYGVVQLINPKAKFEDWHIECAETVARTLSGPLGVL